VQPYVIVGQLEDFFFEIIMHKKKKSIRTVCISHTSDDYSFPNEQSLCFWLRLQCSFV